MKTDLQTKQTTKEQNQIILYRPNDTISLEVRLENDTIWLTQMQIAELFCTTKQNISTHTNNIFRENELVKDSVVKDFFTTALDGKNYLTKFYNLDVIISVGYRVKSIRGTQFRQWANLSKRNAGVTADIYTSQVTQTLKLDLQKHNRQYPPINIHKHTTSHDRFLIIDNTEVYHIGASLKDLGKKLFAFSKLNISPKAIM